MAAMKRKGHVDVVTATKRARAAEERLVEEIAAEESDPRARETLVAQFTTIDGVESGPRLALPRNITHEQLHTLLNTHILKNEEPLPYAFYVDDEEITRSLFALLKNKKDTSDEEVLRIVYQPQAVFRVRMITHCSSSLEGHTEAVLVVAFSPDGRRLATGSGDTSVRLWDLLTGTPYAECKGHTNWVLSLAWSPDGEKLISGSMDQTVRQWDPTDGKLLHTYSGHKGYITSLAWEPYHKNASCMRFISSSKDTTARVWTCGSRIANMILGAHQQSVMCVKWGGSGLIYTASADTTIVVWADTSPTVVRVLKGHGHWVNTLSLNADYVLRTGPFDHTGEVHKDKADAQKRAQQRYDEIIGASGEILVSGSDDTTAIVWDATKQKQPLARLTGHSRVINIVSWSPDGSLFATASFDKNIKLWNKAGKYLATFRGHVSAVYQLAWSADSRMFVSGSKDSTMKVWDTKKLKMAIELPGHADEVYSVDWSPDGAMVASGSKDRLLKLWRN